MATEFVDPHLNDGDRTRRAGAGAFPGHDPNAPFLDGKDIAGLVLAIIMTLGPLAASALGFGAG